jgi:hypothetical protein
MKKLIVWTVALCLVFSFSFVYAQSSTTEAPAGSPGESTKSRQEVKKARASKKKVKKDRGAQPVESYKEGSQVAAPGGSPGAPGKSREDVKKGQ